MACRAKCLSVGTNVGEISIWEVGSRERMVHKPFKVWDISALSMPLQVRISWPWFLSILDQYRILKSISRMMQVRDVSIYTD